VIDSINKQRYASYECLAARNNFLYVTYSSIQQAT